MSHPLHAYLAALRENRRVGTRETSSYPALAALFDAAGKDLKPRVRCVIHPQSQGAGIPDGGFYTAEQLQEDATGDLQKLAPARGVLEVKSAGEQVGDIIASDQGQKYLARYGLLLVTNYRDFTLFGRKGGTGAAKDAPVARERYTLAPDEAAFWHTPLDALTQAHGAQFGEFLRRVLLHNAPLSRPEDLAAFLASYARDALVRVERAADLPALDQLQAALEDALGIHFTDAKGRHFFHSTLVQTLFYGIFSAWVLWSKEHAPADTAVFDWRNAVWSLHVPLINTLFGQLALPEKLRPLGLVEVLDWAGAALNRVDRAQFFAAFETGHAVQYFYEPFLEAFDPQLRKDLGVWYTPPEIVDYMVARVDAVLRDELGLPAGLADERVVVLDPCCGTGAYLVATLRRIARTLTEDGLGAVVAQYVKEAATKRIFGFELLPAPFVVAHLQLGVLLQTLGEPLDAEHNERAGVFLTNALTGWEPREGVEQTKIDFPDLKEERDSATRIKREEKILVVIGNPPYNSFAGVSPKEEMGLVEPYKQGLISEWGIKKFNLDDLYVRFFRLAERRIAEMTGQGVVCFISNFSYLSDPSFVVMRQRFLKEFDALWFDRMNGDSRETGKVTPDGKPDPSVFSTSFNKEGIRVGTAIGLMVRRQQRAAKPTVRFRQFWGVTKRADLLASLDAPNLNAAYEPVEPTQVTRFNFQPIQVDAHYLQWPRLTDLCAIPPSNGLMEKRGGALIDIDRAALERRIRQYYDPSVSWDELSRLDTGLTLDAARFEARTARLKVLAAERFDETKIRPYAIRPFENRWCYYSGIRPLWNEPRPALWAQYWEGNAFLMSRPAGVAEPEGFPLSFTSALGDNDYLRGHAYYFPLQVKEVAPIPETKSEQQMTILDAEERSPKANLSEKAREYLRSLGIIDPDADRETAELIWMHALAIGYAPLYLSENADGVRQDWPRIPLPATGDLLRASAALGRRVAALLDVEQPVSDLAGEPFRSLGAIDRVGGEQLGAGELAVRAGWGHRGESGVTMPGKGRTVLRDRTPAEAAALEAGAAALGLTPEEARACLGAQTYDVFLNDTAFWRNVPERVWDYTLGGYQVIKKWLSYRESAVLGRALTLDEAARALPATVRRIAALLLLAPALDAHYHAVCAATIASAR